MTFRIKTPKSRALCFVHCVLCIIVAATLAGCKTNEKNYREAYEKAVAKNDRNVTDFENTIYNRFRRQVTQSSVQTADSVVPTKVIRVRVTTDGGGIREWLRKYSVVVGEFKQQFNANSMRQRFVNAGYPRTFLVENGEPYYYVVVDSSNDIEPLVALADSIAVSSPVALNEGFPYILEIP